MTLDEAIIHAENKALEKSKEADNCFNYEGPWYEEKRACANEHRQLAKWLKELKAYRKAHPYEVYRFNDSDTTQMERKE